MGSTDPSARPRSPLARHAHRLLLGLTLAAVVAVYAFFVSAGVGTEIASQSRFFTALADAFLGGHLYLDIQPSPELLANIPVPV